MRRKKNTKKYEMQSTPSTNIKNGAPTSNQPNATYYSLATASLITSLSKTKTNNIQSQHTFLKLFQKKRIMQKI
jgi:hypothetical protein